VLRAVNAVTIDSVDVGGLAGSILPRFSASIDIDIDSAFFARSRDRSPLYLSRRIYSSAIGRKRVKWVISEGDKDEDEQSQSAPDGVSLSLSLSLSLSVSLFKMRNLLHAIIQQVKIRRIELQI